MKIPYQIFPGVDGSGSDITIKEKSHTKEMQSIVDQIAKVYELKPAWLLGRKRFRKFSEPRHLCAYFIFNILDKRDEFSGIRELTLASIGAYIGGRDHATVIHSIKTVENWMETDKSFELRVQALKKIVHA